MGSFLEKNIDWEKEADRLLLFVNSVDRLIDNTPLPFSETYLKKMKKEITHFKKVFSE